MAPKVLKIIVVADETAGLIMAHAALTPKEREDSTEIVSFIDANTQEHILHFVLAEED